MQPPCRRIGCGGVVALRLAGSPTPPLGHASRPLSAVIVSLMGGFDAVPSASAGRHRPLHPPPPPPQAAVTLVAAIITAATVAPAALSKHPPMIRAHPSAREEPASSQCVPPPSPRRRRQLLHHRPRCHRHRICRFHRHQRHCRGQSSLHPLPRPLASSRPPLRPPRPQHRRPAACHRALGFPDGSPTCPPEGGTPAGSVC